jgi:hypothetical protein
MNTLHPWALEALRGTRIEDVLDGHAKSLWSIVERPTVSSLARFRALPVERQNRYREAVQVLASRLSHEGSGDA